MSALPKVLWLGQEDYLPVWQRMQAYTNTRTCDTEDQIWLVEHPAVFTQGQAGKSEHILDSGDIPVVQSDRGGQVTYHGPGQVIMYLMLDIRRRRMGVRVLVTLMETAIVRYLHSIGIEAYIRVDAPGVYVGEAKIAALGLRIRKGCSYHGLSLNVNIDLEPFSRVNPCGFEGMEVTSLRFLGCSVPCVEAASHLLDEVLVGLGEHQASLVRA